LSWLIVGLLGWLIEWLLGRLIVLWLLIGIIHLLSASLAHALLRLNL